LYKRVQNQSGKVLQHKTKEELKYVQWIETKLTPTMH
jgi:hypothetical protein